MSSRLIPIVIALSLIACGEDNPTAPTPIRPPILDDLTGLWSAEWRVQFFRHHDGHAGEFWCRGTLTLSQSVTSGHRAPLGGFAVVGASGGCPVGTFEVAGSLEPDGDVSLFTVGPKPPTGECPATPQASYAGVYQEAGAGSTYREISVLSEETVDCPGVGEGRHTFTYILTAWDYS